MASLPGNTQPIPNSYWVSPGRFAAGEYPGDLDNSRAVEKVRGLILGGINYFIDLTEEGELLPYAGIAAEEAGRLGVRITYERYPIKDVGVPQGPAEMERILDTIDGGMADGQGAVYVHCWGGIGRTGTVVGCWLRRHGGSGEAALAQVDTWWREMTPEKVGRHSGSPETGAQKQYVREWSGAHREVAGSG